MSRLNDVLNPKLAALEAWLRDAGEVAVAVSGGVDSLTLAYVAQSTLGSRAEMFHATSAAVPPDATRRVQALAAERNWKLKVLDAGEFDRAEYRANPVNRCFHCKSSLYGSIRPLTTAQLVSGTNLDDLGEFRPGLIAAKEYNVRHPFVEAGIDKRTVRALARHLDLPEIADLPAAPCLSSRVETGIRIEPEMLSRIHAAELMIVESIAPQTVRCRVRASGVVIELDGVSLSQLTPERRETLGGSVAGVFGYLGKGAPVSFTRYRTGSAFLTAES
jgi:pyridinium-3,5-biscarboxylic acid mononucleotide sulfurtransferase